MNGYNLPPGVRESDIPGNRPEDIEWIYFMEGDEPREVYHNLYYRYPDENWDVWRDYDDDPEFKIAIDQAFEDRYED